MGRVPGGMATMCTGWKWELVEMANVAGKNFGTLSAKGTFGGF